MGKKGLPLIVLAVLLVSLVAGSYFSLEANLAQRQCDSIEERMQDITEPNIASFHLQVNEQVKKVKTFAEFLGSSGLLGTDSQNALLQAAVENNGLLRCAVAYPDGSFVTHDNKNAGNVSQDAFFLANMRGEFFITDPQPAVVDPEKTVILFAAPVFSQGNVIGSVIYSYLCDDMDAIFNLDFLDGEGDMMVVGQDGKLLIGDFDRLAEGSNNVLSSFQTQCSHKQHEPKDCAALSGANGGWVFSPSDGSEPVHVRYSKLDFNNWYLVSMVPETAGSQMLAATANEQRDFALLVGGCVLVFAGAVLAFWLSQRRSVDKLTGAMTLEAFKRSAKRMLKKHPDVEYVFVKLDIKNFKLINRVYDFAEGDRVIRNVALALRSILPQGKSIYARCGVDDFVLLIPYTDRETLDDQRERFIEEFRGLMGPRFTTRVDFPTGQYITAPEDHEKPDIVDILEKVNFAHRAAKAKEHFDTIVDFVSDIEETALLEKAVEDRMAGALTDDEFVLFLQPKVSVADEKLCGAEALVRWEVNGKMFMHPTAFIPVLERNGFIVKIDMYMLRCAVRKIRALIDAGEPPFPISVNFSRCHLSNENFVNDICTIVDEYDVPRNYLEIELTESAVFENTERISGFIAELHEAGFRMSMDDFGSGYSSLALLKDLDVDVLKIDKAFFDGDFRSKKSTVVLSSVFSMAQNLDMTTVAEGVETFDQVSMLRELKCDIIQGYYYGRPMPGVDLMSSTFRSAAELAAEDAGSEAQAKNPSKDETSSAER